MGAPSLNSVRLPRSRHASSGIAELKGLTLHTIEKGDVLFRFYKPRHSLVLGTMPTGDRSGGLDVAAEADLGRVGVPLKKNGLLLQTARDKTADGEQNT
jgi:hypothetical protein